MESDAAIKAADAKVESDAAIKAADAQSIAEAKVESEKAADVQRIADAQGESNAALNVGDEQRIAEEADADNGLDEEPVDLCRDGLLLRLDKVSASDMDQFTQRGLATTEDGLYAQNIFQAFVFSGYLVAMFVKQSGDRARVNQTPFFCTNFQLGADVLSGPSITSPEAGDYQISQAALSAGVESARDVCNNPSGKNLLKRPARVAPVVAQPKEARTGTECDLGDECNALFQALKRCGTSGCRREFHRNCEVAAGATRVGNQLFCASCGATREAAQRARKARALEKKELAAVTKAATQVAENAAVVARRSSVPQPPAERAPAAAASSEAAQLLVRLTLAATVAIEAISSAATSAASSARAQADQERARVSATSTPGPGARQVDTELIQIVQDGLLKAMQLSNDNGANIAAAMCLRDNSAGLKRVRDEQQESRAAVKLAKYNKQMEEAKRELDSTD